MSSCGNGRTCSCIATNENSMSFCGYTDGPYAYACNTGCCSQDCSTTRGTLVQRTFQNEEQDPQNKFELMRRNIRKAIFGDSMPLIPMILVAALAAIAIIALANILKGNPRIIGKK